MRTSRPLPMLDLSAVARGASTGFTVLFVGGLLQPVVGHLVPPLGLGWLIAVAVIAFAWSGGYIGAALSPAAQGAAAAVAGYVLVLPLVVMAARGFDFGQIGATAALAVVVGGASGWLTAGRRPTRR